MVSPRLERMFAAGDDLKLERAARSAETDWRYVACLDPAATHSTICSAVIGSDVTRTP
jgi:hypothetical protein